MSPAGGFEPPVRPEDELPTRVVIGIAWLVVSVWASGLMAGVILGPGWNAEG